MSKKKCSWCEAMRKASGVNYVVCPRCKERRKKNNQIKKKNNKELDKIAKKLNKQSINKFKKERGN